jgi:hypothetical protein
MLYNNMLQFFEERNENVFNYLPVTFCIEASINCNFKKELKGFLKLYKLLEDNNESNKSIEESGKYINYTVPYTHYTGHNFWLLKPNGLNRGKGVHVFNKLKQLRKHLLDYLKLKTAKPISLVIQKYIESPLLIQERKFDIRVWTLVTQEMDCYFFKEGYLRTSSKKFTLDPNNSDNKFVHLTNNAIQMYGDEYGNQMSFKEFQVYIDSCFPNKKISIEKDIIAQIKNVIRKSYLAVRDKINPENRKCSFEIFGYDFMIDTQFIVWLIEINSNPCLEESSKLLTSLLNRMMDNAFELTVDKMFPATNQYKSLPKKCYSVEGYPDETNLW